MLFIQKPLVSLNILPGIKNKTIPLTIIIGKHKELLIAQPLGQSTSFELKKYWSKQF